MASPLLTLDPAVPEGRSRLQQILATSLADDLDLVQPRQMALEVQQETLTVRLPLADNPTPDLKPRLQSLTVRVERQLQRLHLLGITSVALAFCQGADLVWDYRFNCVQPDPVVGPEPESKPRAQSAPETKAAQRLKAWLQKQWHYQKARHKANPVAASVEDGAALVGVFLAVLLLQQVTGLMRGPVLNQWFRGSNDFETGVQPGLPGISKQNYLALEAGMRYERVAGILGGQGLLVSRTPATNSSGERVSLMWQQGSPPQVSITATFVRNRLIEKSFREYKR